MARRHSGARTRARWPGGRRGGTVDFDGFADEPSLPLSPEAVAYIDGAAARAVLRRLICLGAFAQALRTAHLSRLLGRARSAGTYATASPGSGRPEIGPGAVPRASLR